MIKKILISLVLVLALNGSVFGEEPKEEENYPAWLGISGTDEERKIIGLTEEQEEKVESMSDPRKTEITGLKKEILELTKEIANCSSPDDCNDLIKELEAKKIRLKNEFLQGVNQELASKTMNLSDHGLVIGKTQSVSSIIKKILNFLLGISGVLMVFAFMYGGFLVTFYGYDEEYKSEGFTIIENTFKSGFFIFTAYLLVSFVLQFLYGII
jgi:hypothetical protein